MLTEYSFKKGFGPKRTKEYFIVQKDGDVIGGLVAGPFWTEDQCHEAILALRPLYNRPLAYVGGHLVGWHLDTDFLDQAAKDDAARLRMVNF